MPSRSKPSDFALLVDGDVYGPSSWQPAMEAVRSKGALARTLVFGAPRLCNSTDWKRKIRTLRIEFVPVPRTTGGSKDPNDIAIGMEATKLLYNKEVGGIALVAGDPDFIYVSQRFLQWGYRFLAVFPEGLGGGRARAFADAGAELAWFQRGFEQRPSDGKAKKMSMLSNDGTSVFVPRVDVDGMDTNDDVVEVLLKYEYMLNADDPLIPAIVRFYVANQLGPLPVWPDENAIAAIHETIQSNPHRNWTPYQGGAVYVIPWSQSASKANVRECGTRTCARIFRGGGPFVTDDSRDLVHYILTRLGFLDNDFNTDVGEAVDMFKSMSMNRRKLGEMGFSIPAHLSEDSKVAILHTAFVSPRSHGSWQIAPQDGGIRHKFILEHLVPEGVGRDQMFAALRTYVEREGLPLRKTYNGLVFEVSRYINAADPTRREVVSG